MKKGVFFIMSVAILAGCSKDSLVENDASLISLKSDAYSVSSRVPFEGAISETNALTALVPTATASASYTGATLHAEGTMTFNSNLAASYNLPSLSDPSKAKLPLGNEVHAFGIYPATGWTLAAANATYTFDGKDDVLGAKEVKVTKTDITDGNYQTLAFKHLLTKLIVKFRAEASAVTIGKIKSVELVANSDGTADLDNKVTFAPVTAAATFAKATTAVKVLPFYKATASGNVVTYTNNTYSGQQYELTINSTLQAYALVAPVSATAVTDSKEYFLKVVHTDSAGTDATNILPVDLMKAGNAEAFSGDTAGSMFTIVVSYRKAEDINVLATLTDWDEQGESVAPVEIK
jgi:hypothetical protein